MTTTPKTPPEPTTARRQWMAPTVDDVPLGAEVTSYAGADDAMRP